MSLDLFWAVHYATRLLITGMTASALESSVGCTSTRSCSTAASTCPPSAPGSLGSCGRRKELIRDSHLGTFRECILGLWLLSRN
ncbi:hypothetical protein CLIM01_03540 [Colletotrichum limetticola]|uniref:Secreted protein n=1 Tax=Colletotrichum limetticola TaxID=1209924 RepID=A0ABQ9Q5Y4_9PEZI|nr:hypothetical protein CLIM01_03540 [Colletotrichum limetticola]